MNAKATRSLFTGLLILLLLAVAVFIYQDTRNNIKVSAQSRIGANSYVLGLDYSGTITKELVNKGDYVHKGDPLAYIKSSGLLSDLNSSKIKKDDLSYPLSESNEIIMLATQDGVIDQENYLAGSYVPANQYIFKITANQSPFVISRFNLSRADFQRLNKSTELQIKLPNGRMVDSTISQITVDNSGANVGATVAVTILSSVEADRNLLIGSPVTTTLHLSQETKLQKIVKYIRGL